MKNKITILIACFILLKIQAMASIIYVDSAHVGGLQNGSSWTTAFSNFQNGINAATTGDSVWVAKGTYQPPQNQFFIMKEGVKIFGGFLNSASSFNQRNAAVHSTILKANSNSVIQNDSNNLTTASIIDGFTITGGRIYNGGVVTGGAGMYNHYASPTISNCTFSKDSAFSIRGGGIMNYYATPFISHCTFTQNYSSYGGAGICNEFSSPTIEFCTFSNNKSNAGGGGIQNIENTATIQHCEFIQNKAQSGAAIDNEGGLPSVTNCSFSGNRAGNGGGIYNAGSPITIEGCSFHGNCANYGGAIADDASYDTKVKNCSFSADTAFIGGGGAIGGDNGTKVYNCSFLNNVALDTSYISARGGAVTNADTINNCSFIGNRGNYGGAVANSPNIFKCEFSTNNATDRGGAIFLFATNAVINNCHFINDSALFGGGISSFASLFTVTNSLFEQNAADSIGAAVYNAYYSTPSIINCTIVRNTAQSGGVIYNDSFSSINITNSIIWSNNKDIAFDATSALGNVSYSLVQGLPSNITNHNLDGALNPIFNDTASGDYRLQPLSPCINVGINDSIPAGIAADLYGNNRINENIVDLGAYEYTLSANLGNDTSICEGKNIILNADNTGSTFLWSTGDTTQTISVATSGVYTVSVSNTHGTVSDTITIVLNALPIVNLGNDTSLNVGNTLILNAQNAGDQYLWNTGDTSQTINVSSGGAYIVTVTNANGCTASDTIVVNFDAVGIGNINETKYQWTISPNPTMESVHINVSDPKLLHTITTIADLSGRIIKTFVIENKSQSISLSDIPAGIYLLKMQNGETAKIVKQ